MLGGSESGINFLSLKKFEDNFSLVIDEVPGTVIRHVVCTNLRDPGNEMTLFAEHNCTVSVKTKKHKDTY